MARWKGGRCAKDLISASAGQGASGATRTKNGRRTRPNPNDCAHTPSPKESRPDVPREPRSQRGSALQTPRKTGGISGTSGPEYLPEKSKSTFGFPPSDSDSRKSQ